MTKTVRVPMPALGGGYRVLRGRDGKMTTVPLTGADVALYRPIMAMDQAPVRRGDSYPLTRKTGGPGSFDDYGDPDDVNPGSDDTEDQVRQLLAGKLDPADLDALCNLIFPDDDDTAPAPPVAAQDKRARQARDQRMAMSRRSGVAQATASQQSFARLVARFPNLKHARVV